MRDRDFIDQEMMRSTGAGGLVKVGERQYLPSTEVRQAVPEWEEEINLRDYLEVMIRRKWLILSILGLVFLSTLIFTLTTPKIYKATASIEVSRQAAKVTKFEEVTAAELQAREFYQTQIKLLKSDALARRVIDKLNLEENPVILKTVFGDGQEGFVFKIKSLLKNLLVRKDENRKNIQAIAAETIRQNKLLRYFKDNFSVQPSRKSMLIGIEFTSRDRQVSRNVVNAFTDEFVQWKMGQRLQSAELAQGFLSKQIEKAKIHLEKAEEQMNKFAEQSGIVSLDSKLNSVYSQLEELNTSLAAAESDFIQKEAIYHQAVKSDTSNLSQVLSNEGISRLKDEYAKLYSEYKKLSTTFYDAYPAVKALKMKMQSVAERIRNEENNVFLAISNEYQAAHKRLETLKNRLAQQKALAMDLNKRATQYKIMAREVATNKGIYQSLLERSKEIESMVGVSASNIHLIDRAALPILPYKPKVMLNLLLAIVIGLMGGVGCAFVLEYFTDTITNPDEICDRFQIPILGVIPLTKTGEGPIETIFASNPRAPLSEALRTTKVSIQLSGKERRARSFLVSSSSPAEGKTTCSINLALAFAGSGEKVLLVDTDLRKPRVHKVLKATRDLNGNGLSSLLAGIVNSGIVQKSPFKNLSWVPAGPIPPNPVELLASKRFSTFMGVMLEKYDRVILDGPPHHGFADILVISQNVGGVILVASLGDTTRQALRLFKRGIMNANGVILGCLVNKVNLQKRYGYRSYYKYYQAYNYDYGGKTRKQLKNG